MIDIDELEAKRWLATKSQEDSDTLHERWCGTPCLARQNIKYGRACDGAVTTQTIRPTDGTAIRA